MEKRKRLKGRAETGKIRQDRWSLSGARGQRSSGDWLCWFSLIFISLLFVLHPLTPSRSPRQLRHSLRTHSHRAVIRPDSTLRLVFSVPCVFFFKRNNQISCSSLLKWISCCGRVYDRGLRRVRLVFIRARGNGGTQGQLLEPLYLEENTF